MSVAAPSRSATGRVLVVDDHAAARQSMAETLRCAGHDVACRSSAAEALQLLQRRAFDVIVTDLKMPGMNGLEFLAALEAQGVDAQVLVVTAHASVATAVEAMRRGAFDYIEKPFRAEQLESLVDQALRRGQTASLPAPGRAAAARMIGESPAMRELRRRIAQAAPTDETVLITGESGTGKELVARSVHASSGRAQQALVGVNCAALSPQLMESELFGHERGAFTSAEAPRVGRFELAHRGSLLLDEVTEISPALQAKLLRVLQEKCFERVGSSQTRRVDVRVLATTNRDLREEIAAGRFREDLYFRLAVVPLHVPPLRERPEDIPELSRHFLGLAAQRLGREPLELTPDAHDLLAHYHWPGNVRELENLMTRASVLASAPRVEADQLRPWLIDPPGAAPQPGPPPPVGVSLQEMERRLIEATLEHFRGHRAKTAKALGIGVRTLTNKLRSYGYAPREKSFLRAG